MIEIKVTSEVIIDTFTPGILGPVELVEGLPPNVTLVDVSMDIAGTVTYVFDDGKDELTSPPIAFYRPEDIKEGTV